MLQCYNRGCCQKFNPEENNDDSCCHHPGEPFFHDAYKGWTCCNKKTVNFTEFLNIKGCTLSKHSNEKPPEPVKSEKPAVEILEDSPMKLKPQVVKTVMPRPPFNADLIKVQPVVLSSLKEDIDALLSKLKNSCLTQEVKIRNIEIGDACKNGGCRATYTSSQLDDTECQYHSGSPIFHEGMKYWSCCQKKTSDFTAFMNQKGCTYGNHKWRKDVDEFTKINCRYDWHQTGSNVIIAIYAKMYHYEKSSIEINPTRLKVRLVFPEQNDAQFELDLELRGVIKLEESTAKMYGTKVEITLRKAEPGTWSKLDFPRTQTDLAQSENNSNTDKIDSDNEDSLDDSDVDLDDLEPIGLGAKIVNLS